MSIPTGKAFGLSTLQAWIYEFCVTYTGRCGAAPTFAEVRAAATYWRRIYIARAIRRLVHKHYMRMGTKGELIALAPPHDRVILAACEELGISLDEMRAPGRSTVLVARARRVLAKRLRSELNYQSTAIAQIVNRHPQTVQEYFDSAERIRRNTKRTETLRRLRQQRRQELRA